jgi:hypothetical protein
MLFGQEDHAHTVLASGWQRDTLRLHLFPVQRVRQLDQDTRAIAHELVCPHGTPVVKIFQNLQGILHDGVALFAANVGHKTNAARVVLMCAGIQTVVLKVFYFGSRSHGALLKMKVAARILQCSNNLKYFKWGQILFKDQVISFLLN